MRNQRQVLKDEIKSDVEMPWKLSRMSSILSYDDDGIEIRKVILPVSARRTRRRVRQLRQASCRRGLSTCLRRRVQLLRFEVSLVVRRLGSLGGGGW